MILSSSQLLNLLVQIFLYHMSILYGLITNSQNDQLPVGLIAQLVEHCTSVTEVMGLIPFQAWIFSGFLLLLLK